MLEQRRVRSFAISATAVRLVTHLDVDEAQIESACESIAAVACSSLAENV
jgi:threonine aldolase